MEYKVKVSRTKNKELMATISDEKGNVMKEIFSYHPELGDKANIHLLKRHVEILAWTGKLEEKEEEK